MSSRTITRQQLEIINRKSLRYPLRIAEKDYFLAWAVETLYTSTLKDRLVFKGGTALHHCYLPQKRFSEDLDFTALDQNLTAQEVQVVIESTGIFEVVKVFESKYTIKINQLRFDGLLGQNGHIKLEIDRFQNVVLPGKPVAYQNIWGFQTGVMVMDEREICAEKIRAASQRIRYRDFYDLYWLLTEFNVAVSEALAILRDKEARTVISARNLLENWQAAKQYRQQDLENIYCSDPVSDDVMDSLIQSIQFDDIPANGTS